jgi:hypothetical protein
MAQSMMQKSINARVSKKLATNSTSLILICTLHARFALVAQLCSHPPRGTRTHHRCLQLLPPTGRPFVPHAACRSTNTNTTHTAPGLAIVAGPPCPTTTTNTNTTPALYTPSTPAFPSLSRCSSLLLKASTNRRMALGPHKHQAATDGARDLCC